MGSPDPIARRMAADGLERTLSEIPVDSRVGLFPWPEPTELDPAPLLNAADDPDALVRRGAAVGLGRSRHDLFEWNEDEKPFRFGDWPDDRIRGPGAAARTLTRLLSDRDVPVRRAAAAGLRTLLDANRAQDPVRSVAGVKSPRRNRVIKALVESLSTSLGDADRLVRWSAAMALLEMNRLGPDGAAVLIDILTIRSDQQELPDFRISDADRLRMVIGLGRLGPVDPDVVPVLAETAAAEGSDVELRLAAVEALGRCGPDAAGAVSVLLELLKTAVAEDDANLRAAVVEGLGRIGRGATDALPALRERLKDGRSNVRRLAAEAVSRIQANR